LVGSSRRRIFGAFISTRAKKELLLVAAGRCDTVAEEERAFVQFAHGADGGIVLLCELTMPRRAKGRDCRW
jgi:hypothetical protein